MRFNCRKQQEGESIEEYLTALYSLVELCDYGVLRDELLRDCIVVGIRDTALLERMQLDVGLTLESAKKIVQQREAISQQGKELRWDCSKKSPYVIEQMTNKRLHQSRQKVDKTTRTKSQTSSEECSRCGR